MWLFERTSEERDPHQGSPFYHVTQISYLPVPVPWTVYPHFHEADYELTFITRGRFFLNLPGCTIPLQAGSVVSIPPKTPHCFQCDDDRDSTHYAIRFTGPAERLTAWNDLLAPGPAYCVPFEKMSTVQRLLDIIQELAGENGGQIDSPVQALVLSILELVLPELRASGTVIRTSFPEYANDILTYLQTHIHEKVTMETLSQTFHLSASHISREFSNAYHTSPINYLIYCRMRTARTYLLRDHMSTSEIAKRLAYHDVYHFIRSFEQFFGVHPDRYLQAQSPQDTLIPVRAPF